MPVLEQAAVGKEVVVVEQVARFIVFGEMRSPIDLIAD